MTPLDATSWSLPFGSSGEAREQSQSQQGAPSAVSPAAARDLSLGLNSAPPTNISRTTTAQSELASRVSTQDQSIPVGVIENRTNFPSASQAGGAQRVDGRLSSSRAEADRGVQPDHTRSGLGAGGLVAATATLPIAAAIAEKKEPGQTNQLQKETLGVPDGRRGSNVSEVSSPSQGPDLSEEANRSISPALGQQSHEEAQDDAVPEYASLPPKEAEAANEIERNRGVDHLEGNLPSYEEDEKNSVPTATDAVAAQTATGSNDVTPGAQVAPMTDFSARKRDQQKPGSARPFSFAASNTLEPETGSRHSEPDRMPQEGALAKEISGVGASDIPDESRAASNRTSKSYSRPFGPVDPNVHDHPAFRASPQLTSEPAVRKESPLPSARRPQEAVHPYPNQAPHLQGASREHEGYRIPGPYGQDYRSPSHPPRTFAQQESPVATQQPQLPGPASEYPYGGNPYLQQNNDTQVPYVQPPTALQQSQQQPMQGAHPLPEPPAEKKQRRIGGIFSGSRNKQVDRERESSEAKRNSLLFKPRSRQETASINSHPSHHSEAQDQVPEMINGAVAGRGGEKRRKSKDLFRSSTSSSIMATEKDEKKKKRHSGLAGLFSRSSKTEPAPRSSTSQGFYRDDMQQSPNKRRSKLGTLQQQLSDQQVGMTTRPDQRQSYSQSYQPPQQGQQQFRGAPPPEGGYYAPQQSGQWPGDAKRADGQYPASAHAATTHDPRQPPQLQTQMGPDSQQSLYQRDDPSSASYHHRDRPNDLRIDTQPTPQQGVLSQSHGQPSAISSDHGPTRSLYSPITQTTTSHSSDYPQRLVHPQPAYPTTRAPINSPSKTSQMHAMDLHRRSRSPRNGRRGSDPNDAASGNDRLRTDDPASQLGTFRNRSPMASAGGTSGADEQQEKPWSITLPEEEQERERAKRRSKQLMIERGGVGSGGGSPTSPPGATEPARELTVAEKMMGAQAPVSSSARPPLASSTTGGESDSFVHRGGGKEFAVAELPGSKAEGYESEEEIPMSATAYPGQEWMPWASVAGGPEIGYGRWDD